MRRKPNPKDLPRLVELADRLGIATALRLAAGWEGRRLYVPSRREPDPDPLIELVLGADGAAVLMEKYGSQTINVPNLTEIIEHWRRKARVFTLCKHGLNGSEIMRETGLSRAQVNEIIQELSDIAGGPWEKSFMRGGRPARFL